MSCGVGEIKVALYKLLSCVNRNTLISQNIFARRMNGNVNLLQTGWIPVQIMF